MKVVLTIAQRQEMLGQLTALLRADRLSPADASRMRWMLVVLGNPGPLAGSHLRVRHRALRAHVRRLSPLGRQLLVIEAPAVAAWVAR